MEATLVEKYKALSFDELIDRLSQKKNTIVVLHTHPDGDAVGSGFALRKLLELSGSNALCVCADEVPSRLKFLTLDESTENSKKSSKSVLYENLPVDFNIERIVCVDTAAPAQLGGLSDILLTKVDLMIVHLKSGGVYADNYIRSDFAATGEIIFNISREFLKRGIINEIPTFVDKCIYAAISSDTGCFKYSNVSTHTHLFASELIKSDIEAAEINRLLFDSKSKDVLRAEKLALENLLQFYDGKVAITFVSAAQRESENIKYESTETMIDIARNIEGVKLGIALKQSEDLSSYRVSMRSNCDIDVSKICGRFGGGGHFRASGCSIPLNNEEEVIELILKTILEFVPDIES